MRKSLHLVLVTLVTGCIVACQSKPKATASVPSCRRADTAFAMKGDTLLPIKSLDVSMSLKVCDSTHGQFTIVIHKPKAEPVVAPK